MQRALGVCASKVKSFAYFLRRLLFVSLLVILMVAGSQASLWVKVSQAEASQGGGSWPTFHHDASRSGFSTDQAPTSPRILWSYQTNGQVKASPVVANGVVYFGSDDGFYVVNQASGSLLWRKAFTGVGGASPAIYDGSVYAGSFWAGGGNVFRLNASTGQQIWNFSVRIYTSILAVASRIFFGGTFNGISGVYSLDALTGSLFWRFNITEPTELAYANGLLYTSSMYFSDGSIYALNATDGSLVWKVKTSYAVYGGPAVAGGVLYAGGGDYGTLNATSFMALNAITGSVIWSSMAPAVGSPALAYGLLYLNVGTGVDALNQTTGTIVWSYGFRTFGISPSIPAVAGGMVFVGGGTETGIPDPTIYALDALTGRLVWSLPVGIGANGSPSISSGVVYVGASDGKLYAIGQASNPALLYTALLSTAAGISFLVALLFYRRSRKQTLLFPSSDTI